MGCAGAVNVCFILGVMCFWGGMRGRRLVLLPVRVMMLGVGCVHGVGVVVMGMGGGWKNDGQWYGLG